MQLAQTTDPLYNSYTYPVYRVKAHHYILRNTITNKDTPFNSKMAALSASIDLEEQRRATLKAASDRVAEIIKKNTKA